MLKLYFRVLVLFLLAVIPLALQANIIINEVQILPTGDRFIELYNTANSPVNLTGWFLQRKTATGNTFGSLVSKINFEGKTIGALSYFVISRNTLNSSSIVTGDLTLSESNSIQLKNSEGVVDKIAWGSSDECSSECPTNPGEGQSIQKTVSSWTISSPTPGSINVISSDSISITTENTTEETPDTTGNSGGGGSTQNKNTVTVTTYYSSSPLSSLEEEPSLKIGAGRDRLGSVGSPLQFRAENNLNYTKNSTFKWNFGDGSEGSGEVLNHVYRYPGDYIVVLNASTPDGQAVARANVKIIEPEIVIAGATPDKIELKNNSKYEISLFGRVLIVGEKFFVFPQDTIVKASQNTSFSSKVTGLEPSGINDIGILVVGSTEQAKLITEIKEQKSEKIAYIQNQISLLQNQMASISRPNLVVQQLNNLPGDETEEIIPAVPQTAVAAKFGWLETLKKFFLRKQ